MNKRLMFVVMALLIWLPNRIVAQSPKSYLVSDFSEDEFERFLETSRKGGFELLLQRYPFSTYGHYEWNPVFASKGDRSVAKMVQKAAEQGVQLGVFAQMDAVSTNDRYFSPRYYSQLLKHGEIRLLNDITADQSDFTVYKNEILNTPSSLNLLLIDKELISFGTLEPIGELMLLHNCKRGVYGTNSVAHHTSESIYRIWDSPERYCAPEGALADSVRKRLMERLDAAGITFVVHSDDNGHAVLNESQRVKKVERWMEESEQMKAESKPMMLGWLPVRVSDRMQSSTTIEEVEWLLSKAASFDAGYGMLVSRSVLQKHGHIDKILELAKHWDRLRYSGLLTEEQKEILRDPYADWHLEQFDETHYLLFPLQVSRRYRCDYVMSELGVVTSDPWEWKTEDGGQFGLRIQVEGKGEIVNPEIETENGVLRFPCTISANQFLWYDYEETAYVTDLNYNVIATVTPQGDATLPFGASQVTLSFENHDKRKHPAVSVRYVLRATPMVFEVSDVQE